jgi:hypothetical protein
MPGTDARVVQQVLGLTSQVCGLLRLCCVDSLGVAGHNIIRWPVLDL